LRGMLRYSVLRPAAPRGAPEIAISYEVSPPVAFQHRVSPCTDIEGASRVADKTSSAAGAGGVRATDAVSISIVRQPSKGVSPRRRILSIVTSSFDPHNP
jgi:hypothetical protein